jgi:NADH-quinone oxidoreductase subunit N
MSLLVFLLACGVGSVVALASRPHWQIGRLAGLVGLLAALGAALFIGPNTSVTIGKVTLVGTEYAGFFLACAAGSGLLLCVVALVSGWPDEIAPAALASFAGLAVATTATDSMVALAAGAAAATTGALVIVRATPHDAGLDARLAEIRTIGLVAAALMVAGIAILRPPWAGQSDSPVFALAFLGLALALAVRSGAVPFHIPAAHLDQTATRFASALLLVWIPAGLGLLAVSWSATTFGADSEGLGWAVAAVQTVAVATLILGALAALVHDELGEVVAYSIVSDAGFVLLALAARTDDAAEPARLWLLAFVAVKTSLVAWEAAVARAFGTSNVPRLRGWLRRTPVLGLALVAILVATLGWPGGAVYEARATLIRLALPAQLQFLFAASMLLSIAYMGRLLVIGVLSPGEDVAAARSELPRWPARPAVPEAEIATSGVAAAAGALAADLPLPTTASATAGPATPEADKPGVVAESVPAPTPVATAPKAPSQPRRLAAAWRLNRTLEVSLVVAIGTALAAALALGGLGAGSASRSGIPMDVAAHATPTTPPTPTPAAPTSTPLPTLAPFPSGGPSGSTGSPGPSGSPQPSPTPTPVKTSDPVRGNSG